MLTIRSSAHIPTNRLRRSFRACRSSTGAPRWRAEARRRILEWISLIEREARRNWLAELWSAHSRRLAFRFSPTSRGHGHSSSGRAGQREWQ